MRILSQSLKDKIGEDYLYTMKMGALEAVLNVCEKYIIRTKSLALIKLHTFCRKE